MKVSQKFYIQAIKCLSSWSTEQDFVIQASCFKRTSSASQVVIDIEEQDLEFTIADISPEALKNGHVEQLREVKAKLQAETHLKVQDLDEQIESLLAIEYKAEE